MAVHHRDVLDTVGGGDFDDGAVISYEGPKTVAQQVSLGRLYHIAWLRQADPISALFVAGVVACDEYAERPQVRPRVW